MTRNEPWTMMRHNCFHPVRLIRAGVLGVLLAGLLTACAPAITLVTESYSAPLPAAQGAFGSADTASMRIDGATLEVRSLFETLVIGALAAESDQLVEARVEHAFPITFETTEVAAVRLVSADAPNSFSYVGERPVWTTSIHPAARWSLNTRSSAGDQRLNLGLLAIQSVSAATTAGNVLAVLPSVTDAYPVDMRTEEGNIDVTLLEAARTVLDLETLSGSIDVLLTTGSNADGTLTTQTGRITLRPTNSTGGTLAIQSGGSVVIDAGTARTPALRVEVASASEVQMPDFMSRMDGSDEVLTAGVWETADYATAATRLTITINAGSGAVIVR